MMQNDVEVLLSLQADDTKISELETRLRALEPRMSDLDRKREGAVAALTRARTAVETEERRQRDLTPKSQRTSRCRSGISLSWTQSSA